MLPKPALEVQLETVSCPFKHEVSSPSLNNRETRVSEETGNIASQKVHAPPLDSRHNAFRSKQLL